MNRLRQWLPSTITTLRRRKLHSGDAARAFRLVGEKGINGKTYVLGNGKARPLADYIKIIRDEVNPKAKLDLGAIPYAPKQVMYLQADVEELRRDTGFKPEMRFDEGIKKILEGMRE